jgi:hypothetical protein
MVTIKLQHASVNGLCIAALPRYPVNYIAVFFYRFVFHIGSLDPEGLYYSPLWSACDTLVLHTCSLTPSIPSTFDPTCLHNRRLICPVW